jgi:predicted ribosome quality control (RQC) complex YloA/Tae2 family protein
MKFPAFNYALMEILCKELQERIANFKIVDCLPNDLRRFFLILHGNHHSESLFFCFIPPFLRFHLTHSTSHISSSHPLLSFLKGAILKEARLLQQDRILQLTFIASQGELRLIAEFFSKHPNYYLVQHDGKILFALHPLLQTHYVLPPPRSVTSEIAPWLSSHREVDQAYAEIEKEWELTKAKQALKKQLSKQIKKLKIKEQKLMENLKECVQWSQLQHEGDLIKSHLASIKRGTASLTVHDWLTDQSYHLKLDPSKMPQEEMAARFKRAKKLQMGQAPLAQYLERIQTALRSIEQQQEKLNLIQTIDELIAFKTSLASLPSTPAASSAIPSSPIYREYFSATGVPIWVGKNAKANDLLTFQLANGRDWWLHVSGYSGSHVIIRLGKNQEPDSETLKDAMQIALYYSKARTQGEGEICFTQRKYVSRLGKGKTGLVQISKHQIAWIRFDPARWQILKERSE